MTKRTPKPAADITPVVPAPAPADYSDEISEANFAALRALWPQSAAGKGPLVYEPKW